MAVSTSVKMAAKAEVVAGVLVPGRKKETSVMLLPMAVKMRWGLKAAKSLAKPKRVGVAAPAFALTRNPVPGVEKTAPRGELALKKLAGRRFGSEKESGTPSQLISRRRPPKEPLAPATEPPPTAVRKLSRVGVMAAGVGPADSKVVKAACAAGAAMSARESVK